jgi:hypothetical protein
VLAGWRGLGRRARTSRFGGGDIDEGPGAQEEEIKNWVFTRTLSLSRSDFGGVGPSSVAHDSRILVETLGLVRIFLCGKVSLDSSSLICTG